MPLTTLCRGAGITAGMIVIGAMPSHASNGREFRTMAHIAGVSESRIRSLRDDGYSWERIARKYKVDPRRFGYGQSRYDHDRDKWKGVPPGLAKKGGLPPGQAKKFKEHHDKKHRD